MTTATGRSPVTGSFIATGAGFADVVGEHPTLVPVVATDAHEGPVYLADEDALYFTTLPAAGRPARIARLALDGLRFPLEPERVSTVPVTVTAPNGMTIDGEGRLVVCEQGALAEAARITSIDRVSLERSTVVAAWRGMRLNSPNDVVVGRDGVIWFTDPSYGHLQGFRPAPQSGDFVYRHDPATGVTDVAADRFDKPNGIALSPDERVLYVTDSGANQEPGSFYVSRPHHIVAFDVIAGERLRGERLFAVTTPGFPDGLKVDAAGRVYASCATGVQVFSPDGELLGEIRLPGTVNFAFGGADRNVLFITADDTIWAATLAATGPPVAVTDPRHQGA